MIPLLALAIVLAATPSAAQFASELDRREALQHYRTGQELLSAEQFEKAAEAFQRAIDKDRLLTLAYYGQGQAYMALRRYASAVLAFTNCREAYRNLHRLSEVDRFSVERQRDDELREMRETLRRLREDRRQPRDAQIMQIEARIRDVERQRSTNAGGFVAPPEVSLALGSAHFRNGQAEDAEREWKTAVEANPRMGEAHNNLAVVYMLTGRKAEAEDAVRAAERAGFRVNPQLKDDIRRMSS
ncbi:MAG: tetratricopeptide repeat protein [Acidobacteria bacterium]|nr:tetratricopeptide repeat protein [Acidobacteriota bacterium]